MKLVKLFVMVLVGITASFGPGACLHPEDFMFEDSKYRGQVAKQVITEWSPPKFIFYSKTQPDKPLTREEFQKLHPEANLKLWVYVHGWNSKSPEKAGSNRMKDVFLSSNGPDAVIVMDWSKASKSLEYADAATNFHLEAQLLHKGFSTWNTSPSQVQFHGHSLGAHIIGEAARLIHSDPKYNGEKISKVFGYDPAGPLLKSNTRPDHGLRPDVAPEVFTLNTDKVFGAWKDLGTKNVYIDDHPLLKKCGWYNPACKHRAAVEIGEEMAKGLTPWESSPGLPHAPSNQPNPSEKKRIRALVLDVSPSMQAHGRIQSLVASANGLVSSVPLNSVSLAVIVFGGYAELKFGPKVISSEEVRKEALQSLPTVRTNIWGTSIGAGLKAAAALANNGEICVDIVLITDGEENTSPYAKDVRIPPCTVTHTVAFSEEADGKLEQLAEKTGGKASFLGDKDSLKNLPGLISDMYYHDDENGNQPIRLITKPVTNLNQEVNFNLDPGLGKDLQVSVLPLEQELKDTVGNVKLVRPDGAEVKGDVDQFGRKQFKVEGVAPSGGWRIKFRDGMGQRRKRDTELKKLGVVEVKSFPNEREQPVTLEPQLSSSTLNDGHPIVVSAALRKGGKLAVLGAEVVATVYDAGDVEVARVTLEDSGVAADEFKADGIYSRALWHDLPLNQRHQVVITAKCVVGGCFTVDAETEALKSLSGKAEKESKLGYEFEREVNAGSVKYTTKLQNQTEMKPSSIGDLKVTEMNFNEKTVELTWTNPGAFDGEGTVSGLRLSLFTSLMDGGVPLKEWSSADNSTQFKVGPPGSQGGVRIRIPDESWASFGDNTNEDRVFWLQMTSINSRGLEDDGSNLALAFFEEPKSSGVLLWVAVAAGIVAVLGGIGGLIYRRLRKGYVLVRRN